MKIGWKHSVFSPSTGRRKQHIHLIFIQPGVYLSELLCTSNSNYAYCATECYCVINRSVLLFVQYHMKFGHFIRTFQKCACWFHDLNASARTQEVSSRNLSNINTSVLCGQFRCVWFYYAVVKYGLLPLVDRLSTTILYFCRLGMFCSPLVTDCNWRKFNPTSPCFRLTPVISTGFESENVFIRTNFFTSQLLRSKIENSFVRH